ncbi:MAG: molybdenum cofactor guanylyltransferase [Defluviitaleaceae bacterium]|nr:molybdenum cofactor guanylyltransferase [Defluviitaleaceae bacterium]
MKNFGDAFILCGGKSRRMGFDKSMLKIEDDFVIDTMRSKLEEAFDQVRLCAHDRGKFASFGMNIVEDVHKGNFGPAAAIHAALSNACSRYVFVVAVDMPLLDINHINHMKQTLEVMVEKGQNPHALIPKCGEFSEVLYAFYSVDALGAFEEHLKKQSYKIRDILAELDVAYMPHEESCSFDPSLKMFTNLNYVEDLKKIDQ